MTKSATKRVIPAAASDVPLEVKEKGARVLRHLVWLCVSLGLTSDDVEPVVVREEDKDKAASLTPRDAWKLAAQELIRAFLLHVPSQVRWRGPNRPNRVLEDIFADVVRGEDDQDDYEVSAEPRGISSEASEAASGDDSTSAEEEESSSSDSSSSDSSSDSSSSDDSDAPPRTKGRRLEASPVDPSS